MNESRIEQLLETLPSRAPYVMRIPRDLSLRGFPAETDLYAYALNDPAFGCGYIRSFLDLKLTLPTIVYESQLVRPYCYSRYKNDDEDVRRAFELHKDRQSVRSILLDCMLVRAEYDYPSIGKKLHLTEASIDIYGTLFWDVRGRLNDRFYINTLVYPESRQVELVPGYAQKESPRNLALRITVDSGLNAAEEFLGLCTEGTGGGRAEQAEAFAAKALSTGNFLAKMGLLHQKLPGLDTARAVRRSMRSDGKQRLPSGSNTAPTISLSQAIGLTLDRITRQRDRVGASPPNTVTAASVENTQRTVTVGRIDESQSNTVKS